MTMINSMVNVLISYQYLIIVFTFFSLILKMSENRKETAVIIGGGIIGLTTAYELSKKFDVHLVEKRQSI